MVDRLLHIQTMHDDGTTTTQGWPITEEDANAIVEERGEPILTMLVPDAAALGETVKGMAVHHWKD